MNIKLIPNEWVRKTVPLSVIKHRLLVTDPTYKFSINAVVNARSNIAVRRDSNNNDYYDIQNMSVVQDAVVSPTNWITFINQNFNLNLAFGDQYQSTAIPELFFDTEESRNIFDAIYDVLQDNKAASSEGVNIFIDFNIKLSGGFIRNKLGLDTANIKNWILNGLNFSVLRLIMTKNDNDNYIIKDNYITLYNLSKDDIELLESIFSKHNELYPFTNNTNIFWWYMDAYENSSNLESKQALFGFQFNGATVTEVHTKNVSFTIDQYNRPMYIQTQNKWDAGEQRVYITMSRPNVPVTIINNSIVQRTSSIEPSKNIQTKINNHIYMVNKK